MKPDVGEVTEQLYEALEPFARWDEELDWPLLRYLDALCRGLGLEWINALVADRDDRPGWAIVFDPDEAPAAALPYLAQFAGVELTPEMSEAERREAIKVPVGFRRGSPDARVEAIRRTLTGSRTVLVVERFESNAWREWIRTYASETPDPERTERAVRSEKPVGIVPTYEAISGQSWADLEAGHADWNEVESSYADWDDVRSTLPPA